MSYLNLLNLIVGAGADVTFLTWLWQQKRQQEKAKPRRIRVESQQQLARHWRDRR